MTHPPQLRQRLTAAVTAGGTLALTLALLAGMPYVLWRATGLPWPEHVSSVSEFGRRLTQPVSDPLMIDLLAVVGWVCWAAFATTVVRETCWYTTHLPQLLRDRHAHDEHVAALSVKGSLAALCIGTLVVALIGLWRPQTVSAQQPSSPGEVRTHIAATAPLVPALGQPPTPPAAAATAPARAMTAGLTPERPGPPGKAEEVEHIEYTVTEGDTLWDIAHTHMGDALTWPRIYALNKDRVQSDGARLTDPDRIRPGWHLIIPIAQSATPPPTPAPAPVPDATPSPPSAPPAQPTPDQGTGTGHEAGGEHTPAGQPDRHEETAARKTDTEPGPAAIGLGEASLIGITAAAGLLAARRYWYWHQHRLREPNHEAEVPALSPLVDKAAQAAHAATRPPRPPDPDALVTHRTPAQKPRSTGTVTIGVRDNAEVLLDELARPGGCAWTGPGSEGAARALLVGILTAAERQRPGPPLVTAIVPENVAEGLLPSLPAQFTALTQSADTAEAIRAAEQHLIAHARTRYEQDTDPAATGPTITDSTPETGPGTLLLLTVPDAAHTGQLQALATRSRPGTLIVLTLGAPLPGAASWHIADDGTTHANAHDQHPSPLRLFHLTPEAGRDLAEVLLTSHGQRPRLRILPTPSRRPDDEHSDDEHPEAPAAPMADEPPTRPYALEASRPTQTKPVRLHVLGPITLYARGHQDPVGTNLRSEVHELLALLAAHPAGLLASDIADKLHLDPGSDQNALKNLRRAVRRALRAATGITAQEFIVLQGELHKLHPELVETDLADFSRNLNRAFSVTDGEEAENDALSAVRDALAHYRGPFAQGGDYLWADAIREHLAMKATDAALRLARKAEHADAAPRERDAVLTLLEHLSILHPDHERLAQHTIRLYQAAGRHDAARHTYTRLKRHLTDLGLEPEPATQALVAPRTHSR
ncbi:BTAD domain-containing putative transcriptional regulator [Streptomyces yerevanensis]|uniref:BTAD domain-containing putative transcriptional regulator n=1 Tax=Streptomyces yerevanensis TaxID=66378 RepID=UPI0005256A50|nr:BTAD domain-containing putative transcriptional regulator [Streptomyces yerevanensis]